MRNDLKNRDNLIYLVCRESLLATHSNMLWIDYGLTIHIVNKCRTRVFHTWRLLGSIGYFFKFSYICLPKK
jgi:hypothetical protein